MGRHAGRQFRFHLPASPSRRYINLHRILRFPPQGNLAGANSCRYSASMSFVAEFNALPLESLLKASRTASANTVREAMSDSAISLAGFAALISPAAGELLEPLCRRSQA